MAGSAKLSLRGLRTFCAAARYESFREASEVLFITASAVSHQIKSLEEELGEPLFDRTSRELVLTATGKALYDDVNPLIEQLDTVVARYKKGAISSTIKISVQPFFGSEYFVPRLSEFTARHPDIDIQVGTSDESAEKHPADADMSIRLFRTPPTDLSSDLLFPLRLAPAGSPQFKRDLKVKNKVITSDFPVIIHATYPKAWSQWSEVTGIQLPKQHKVTRLDSMIAVLRAAQRGIGAALVPVPIGELWFSEGSIVPLFDKVLTADVSYYLVCPRDRLEEDDVARLHSWILQNFAE